MPKKKPYFINPPIRKSRRGTSRRRRLPKRRADGTFMESVRTRTGHKVSKAAWHRSGYRRNPKMARRRLPGRDSKGRFLGRHGGGKRRHNAYLPNRRRRHHRRNPFGLTGIMGQAANVALGGAGVTAGKIVNRQAIGLLKLDPSSAIGIGGQFAVAMVAGVGIKRFARISGPFVDGLVYGAAAGAIEAAIKRIMPDAAGRLLGEYEYEVPLAAYATAGALPPGREQAALMGMYATGTY